MSMQPSPGTTVAATALVAAVAFVTPIAHSLDGWQPFVPPDSAFRVEMPAEPTTERKERWFPISDFVSTVYTARVGDDAFGLNHTDLPRVAMWVTSNAQIFDSARDGFIEDSNATEVSYDQSEAFGRPARELVYDIPAQAGRPALRGRARMFFVKNRLYIIWAEVTPAISGEEVDRYFASLRLGADES